MAKLIDEKSIPASDSTIDLFSLPATQVVFENGYWQEINPSNSCTSEGPWVFVIQSDPHYLHLNRNYVYFKAKIVKEDGTAITSADSVAPINLLGKTLFKQVKVNINGKCASDSGSMYAYRTYLETELNFGSDMKTSYLQSALYYKDQPASKVDSKENVGWQTRAKWFSNGYVEIMAPLHVDLFMSDKLILDQAEIVVELYRNSDDFLLMNFTPDAASGDKPSVKCKLEITDMKWYVRKTQVSNSVKLGIEAALIKNPAKYPIRRVSVTKVGVSEGRQSVPTTPVFNGQLPRRMVVGFVSSDAFFGNSKKSPFNFSHHNVKEISVHAGGNIYPRDPLKMNYAKNQFVPAYVQFFESIGCSDEGKSNMVSIADFMHSTCLYIFDLTPNEQDTGQWQLIKEGSTTVHCEFDSAVPAPGLEMIVYAEFDNLAILDHTRTIHFDYSV